MEIVMRKVSELTPYEKNAKTHDKRQIDNVAQSIKEMGWLQPLVVDRDGVVVVGHCRLLAAKKLKQKEVPCLIADDLTDEQIKKYRVLDNKLNESPWDLGLLAEDIEGLDFSGYEVEFDIPTIEEPKEKVREDAPFSETISIVIDCEDDAQAEELFERLSEEGYKCRVSTL
jgi:ParB-like chromosome segregation protein Spo0J